MKKANRNRIGLFAFAGVLLIFGIISIVEALKITIWKGYLPGPGFMLLLCACIMIVFTVLWVISEIKKGNTLSEEDVKNETEETVHELKKLPEIIYILGIPAALGVAAFLMKYLGLIFMMTMFLFVWFKVIAKKTWFRSAILTISIIAVLYAVFILWLQVPVPTFFGLF